MRLLALDQASRVSGWAFFEDDKLVDYGKIELKEDEVGPRLVTLKKEIIDLIDKYKVDMVAFEDIQMQSSIGSNVVTFKVLAEVYGVIHEFLEEMRINYIVVPSVKWKSTLGIKGKKRPDQKRNAQLYVEEKYSIKATQDECDAICIGSHICAQESGFDWTKS